MRRMIPLVVVLSLAVGLLTGIAVATSDIAGPTEIKVVEVGGGDRYVDNGKRGFSFGDTRLITHDLYTTDGATKLGDMHGSCIAVHAGKHEEWECSATARFGEGSVMVAGSFPPPETTPAWAVVGGTATYQNARGVLVFGTAPNDKVLLTLDLIP